MKKKTAAWRTVKATREQGKSHMLAMHDTDIDYTMTVSFKSYDDTHSLITYCCQQGSNLTHKYHYLDSQVLKTTEMKFKDDQIKMEKLGEASAQRK